MNICIVIERKAGYRHTPNTLFHQLAESENGGWKDEMEIQANEKGLEENNADYVHADAADFPQVR